MKLPASFSDIRGFTNDLHTFIATNRFDYRGGIFRVAMTLQNGVMRFAEGCLLFQREKIACIPKADYGEVLFLEEWIEPLSEAENFLPPFLSGQRSIAGQKITTQFTRTDWYHQNAVEFVMTGWREWRFLSRADFLDRNENIQLTQELLTRKGLTPHLTAGHAIPDKIFGEKKWESISSPHSGHFVTILPETRALLLSGKWLPVNLPIEIEANISLMALELQLLIALPPHPATPLLPLHTITFN